MRLPKWTVGGALTKRAARQRAIKNKSLGIETLEQRTLLTAATAGDFATLKQLAESGQRYEIALTADIVVGGDDMIAVAGNISIDGRQVVDGVETVHSITVASGTDRTCSFMTVSDGSLTLSNLTISGFNYVGGYGGVFRQTGGTLTIDSGTTISNCGAYNGAVADIDHGTFIVSGATFSGNTAANDGGVFDLEMGTLIINSGTFSNNTAVDDGGVVYADTQFAEVAINNGLFTGNSAYIGGVAYLNSGKITIKAGRFLGNSASFEGGVVSTTTSFSELIIDDGVFTGNTAAKGGVACFSAGTVTINNGTFSNNAATVDGGVIHTDSSSAVVTIEDGSFTGNKAVRGGVAYTNAGKIEIKAGTYSNNTATSTDLEDGGAVIFSDTASSEVIISGGTITNNRSMRDGGVICSRGEVTVKGGTISGNTAAKAGGVIFADQGNVYLLDGAVITGNSAKMGGVVCGAGQRTLITFQGGSFTKNTAVNGGVLCVVERSAAVINGGTFGGAENTGNSATHGGAVFVIGAKASVNGGTFAWNSASLNGGAVCVTNHDDDLGPAEDGSTSASVTGGLFTRNTALIGGGLYVGHVASLPWTTTVHLGAVTMEYNSAVNGGAIANRGAVVTDADTEAGGNAGAVKTFTANAAKYNAGTEEEPIWIGNGGAIFNNGEITLSNAVFSGNYCAGNGGAVDNLEGGTVTLAEARFSDNSALEDPLSVDRVDWGDLDPHAGDGGAMQNWGTAAIVDGYFTGNSAHDGGAIANGEGAVLTLSQTTAGDPEESAPLGFSHNGAVYGGAIINVGTLTRTADETAAIEFTGNLSYNNGGAISNSDNGDPEHPVTTGSLELYGASFTENTAGNPAQGHTGYGGAVLSAKPLTIFDSTFQDNLCVGGKGGAIDQTAATLSLTEVTFIANGSPNTLFGGAVNTWVGGTITDCVFQGNSAKYGGAVSVLGNTAVTTITHTADNATSFNGNSAVSYGGALYASGTVQIDGAAITNNTASLGGGVMAITSDLTFTTESGTATVQKGRGKVTFTGQATTFSGNTATKKSGGKSVGSDLCASSSNSAAGNGAVIEIETMPQLGSAGYALAVDRSILVLAGGATIPASVNVYANKEFTCDYTYSGTTLAFTSLSSDSGINKWWIYWGGSASGPYTEYDGTGSLPSGTVADGTAVLIKGFGVNTKGASYEMNYYLIPSVLTGSGESMEEEAPEALLDDALLDDAEAFEWLAPRSSALEQYCEECYL